MSVCDTYSQIQGRCSHSVISHEVIMNLFTCLWSPPRSNHHTQSRRHGGSQTPSTKRRRDQHGHAHPPTRRPRCHDCSRCGADHQAGATNRCFLGEQQSQTPTTTSVADDSGTPSETGLVHVGPRAEKLHVGGRGVLLMGMLLCCYCLVPSM